MTGAALLRAPILLAVKFEISAVSPILKRSKNYEAYRSALSTSSECIPFILKLLSIPNS